jgi:hypothetical protein
MSQLTSQDLLAPKHNHKRRPTNLLTLQDMEKPLEAYFNF